MPIKISDSALMWPTVLALRKLGGSGNIAEIEAKVLEFNKITEAQQAELMPNGSSTKIAYYLAWARTNLKRIAAVENPAPSVWALTELGTTLTEAKCDQLRREWKTQHPKPPTTGKPKPEEEKWKTSLLERLKAMSPKAFERLAQRLLREAGFRNVEVLGQAGDGGIDGVGVYRLSLVSFPIYFQCKRYQGSVSSGAVRDFRGAMAGRGEKGLLITTGAFTASARSEATRDGAAPVELVSGEALCDLLKEHRIGIRITERVVEDIEIDPAFFDQFEK